MLGTLISLSLRVWHRARGPPRCQQASTTRPSRTHQRGQLCLAADSVLATNGASHLRAVVLAAATAGGRLAHKPCCSSQTHDAAGPIIMHHHTPHICSRLRWPWRPPAALAALLVVAALLLPACAAPPNGANLDAAFCAALPAGEAAEQCSSYVNAAASMSKWTAAVRWAKYFRGSYTCANVTALCLLNDMHSERPGSGCKPAPNGIPCELDGTGGPGSCWAGACLDASQVAVNMLLAKDGFLRMPVPGQQQQQPWQQAGQLLQQQQQPVAPQPASWAQTQQLLLQQAHAQQLPPQQQAQQYSRLRMAAAQEAQQAALPPVPTDGDASSAGELYDYDLQRGPGRGGAGRPQQPGAAGGSGGTQQQQQQTQKQQPGQQSKSGSKQPGGKQQKGGFVLDPDDPYGLSIDLGDNPKISEPFVPPAPPTPSEKPPAAAPPPPRPHGALTLDVQPDAFLQAVPPSFLGVSREWTPAVWYDQNLEAFGRVFAELGPAPILRIGGATQEGLIRPPNSTFMDGLLRLHCYLGVRFIIGLPLFQNAPQLPLAIKAAFDAAFKDYPYAILSYELGNEPNYWPTRAGGFTQALGTTQCSPIQSNPPGYQLVGSLDTAADRANEGYAVYRDTPEPYLPYKPQSYCFTPQTTIFASGNDNFNTYFQTAANALTGCSGLRTDSQAAWGWPYWGPPGFNRRVLSGPAWGDFNLDFNAFRTFLQNSQQCYLGEATMHYYGPNRNTTFPELFNRLTGVSPTGNPPNKALITVVKEFIAAARTSNITLRVSEANSVPDGGQSNLSNTIGAAIWTLVTALEFAQAGASGINFHWGSGGTPPGLANAPAYVGMQVGFRNASAASGGGADQTAPYPVVRVPFYGYVLFSRAFGGNGPGIFLNFSSDAVVSECRELFFTYAILVPHAGLVSVVAANANPNITCDVTAALPGVVTTDATLQLLVGPRGDMAAYEGVSLAGQTYQGQEDGRMRGKFRPQRITPHQHNIRTTGWTFTVPPASAALLQIPLIGGANYGVGRPSETPDLAGSQQPGGTQEAVDPATATWSPPVAVPFPPLPAFEPQDDEPAAGDVAANGGSKQAAAGAGPAGGSMAPQPAGGAPASGGSDAIGGAGAGGGGGGAGVDDAAAGGNSQSALFEYQPGRPAATVGLPAGQAAVGMQAVQAPMQTAQPAAAAPVVQQQQLPAGQYQLKGYTRDGRPIYTWQQQQPVQQQAGMLESGALQLQPQDFASGIDPSLWAASQQQQQQWQQQAAAALMMPQAAAVPVDAGLMSDAGDAGAEGAGPQIGGLWKGVNALLAPHRGGSQQRRRPVLGGLFGGGGGGRRTLLGWLPGLKHPHADLLGLGAVGGSTAGAAYSMPFTPSAAAGGSSMGAGGGLGGSGGNTAGRTYAGNTGGALGALGGAGGAQQQQQQQQGVLGLGGLGQGGPVNININVQAPLKAQLPVAYTNPNLNFVPAPAQLAVSPRTRPVPQSAAAEMAVRGPTGLGRVWPRASNTSALDVGVDGMGGYTLYPPGYDVDAVDRAAAQCPGIARIRDIQARAGTGGLMGGGGGVP